MFLEKLNNNNTDFNIRELCSYITIQKEGSYCHKLKKKLEENDDDNNCFNCNYFTEDRY